MRRRNFYNSPDWRNGLAPGLPQEILLAAPFPMTVAVKRYGHSAWTLTWSPEAGLTPHSTSKHSPGLLASAAVCAVKVPP